MMIDSDISNLNHKSKIVSFFKRNILGLINILLISVSFLIIIKFESRMNTFDIELKKLQSKAVEPMNARLKRVELQAQNYFLNSTSNGFIVSEMQKMKSNFTNIR